MYELSTWFEMVLALAAVPTFESFILLLLIDVASTSVRMTGRYAQLPDRGLHLGHDQLDLARYVSHCSQYMSRESHSDEIPES